MSEQAEIYLVYTTTEEGRGSVYLWWKPNRCGYTRFVSEAGRYTREEAEQIVRMRGEEGAFPLAAVLEATTLKIDGKLAPGVHEEIGHRTARPGQRALEIADAVIDELKGRSGMWPDDLDEETAKEVRVTIARIVGGT